jgi:pimeloyl-ACP methyl ester carboxylesterase
MQKLFRWVRRGARVMGLLVCAAATMTAQGAPDTPPYPAPGRLVDVGGWRLHLNCTGEAKPGEPRVILEAGAGDFSVEWSLVQPGVARFARVCSYDRGGDGWSDLGPHPRTMHQVVHELHTLLENSGERPPYVLVGHSYGGVLVRLYQSTYPSEVVGMVLVEAGSDDPWRMMPDGKLVRSSELATGQPVPAVKKSGPLRESDIPPAALSQMRAGLAEASVRANEGPRAKLPIEAQRMRTWALGQLKHVAAAVNPVEHEELAALRAERAKGEHPLGDLPLVVLTRGLSDSEGPALEAEHRRDHAAVAALSRKGKQIIATRSGHHVQLDEPALVVSSIQQVLGASAPGPEYSIEQIRRSCIAFSDAKRGTEPYEIGDCRVSSFGTLGTVENQTYYYALYCLITNDRVAQGTCRDTSFNARYHSNRGLVVFVSDRASKTARIAYERVTGDVGQLAYEAPEIVRTAFGTVLYLPIRVDGTGLMNESEHYLRKAGTWQRLDADSWLKDLHSRIPKGLETRKGVWPDLSTMRADVYLYHEPDANCCGTGGRIRVRLAIRDMRFVIASAVVDTTVRDP